MKLETVLEGVCCTDCLMIIANDDDSGMYLDGDPAAHRQAMADVWGSTIEGLQADGDVRACGYWVAGDQATDHSTAGCDACGSPLHGERHEISVLGYVS